MIRHTEAVTVRRPVPEVFDFVATHNYENHPRWEAEVLEIRPLTVGPVRVGASTWAPSPAGRCGCSPRSSGCACHASALG